MYPRTSKGKLFVKGDTSAFHKYLLFSLNVIMPISSVIHAFYPQRHLALLG